jgi:hypothetical protein
VLCRSTTDRIHGASDRVRVYISAGVFPRLLRFPARAENSEGGTASSQVKTQFKGARILGRGSTLKLQGTPKFAAFTNE